MYIFPFPIRGSFEDIHSYIEPDLSMNIHQHSLAMLVGLDKVLLGAGVVALVFERHRQLLVNVGNFVLN